MKNDDRRKQRNEKRAVKKKGNRHRRGYLKDQLQRNPDDQGVEDDFQYGASESVGKSFPTLGTGKTGNNNKKRKHWERNGKSEQPWDEEDQQERPDSF